MSNHPQDDAALTFSLHSQSNENSLKPTARKSRRAGSHKAATQDVRQHLVQRRQATAIQIRKQRKEDLLWRKRHAATPAVPSTSQMLSGAIVSKDGASTSSASLATTSSIATTHTASNAQEATRDDVYAISLASPLSSDSQSVDGWMQSLDAALRDNNTAHLQSLLAINASLTRSSSEAEDNPLALWSQRTLESPERVAAFVHFAVASLRQSVSSSAAAAATVANAATTPTAITNATTPTNQATDTAMAAVLDLVWQLLSLPTSSADADDYYGTPPPRWSDILVDNEAWMRLVLSLMKSKEAMQILGTLVLDSPRAADFVLPHWNVLVQELPLTSYVCAVVLRKDSTTLGTNYMSSLTPAKLTMLLQSDETAVEASWMLESLSWREESVVQALCQDALLLPALSDRLLHAAHHMIPEFVVPTLQALKNLAVACDGHCIPRLLSIPQLVQACCLLLDNGLAMDILPLAAAFMCDAGLSGHPSTNVAVPAFLPRVLHIIAHPGSTLPWRREAAWAVCSALREPPETDSYDLPVEVQTPLDSFLTTFLWNDKSREQIMESLVDLLQRPDTTAVLSSLEILDYWLRYIPLSRELFEELSGVDKLDLVCSRAIGVYSNELEEASTIAAALLDDFFEDVHDDESHSDPLHGGFDKSSASTLPMNLQSQYVFRAPPSVGVFDFSAQASPNSTTRGGMGRGRDRTIPAWMQTK
jgi:Importin beta binding domain